MAAKRAAKREDLKGRLIAAATRRIAASGLLSLRARDLAEDAGCALGALYTVFEDIDTLILHASAATLGRIGAAMKEAVRGRADPDERLLALGEAYLRFARANPKLWRALFEHHLPEARPHPEWHRENLTTLLAHIATPLAALEPALDRETLMIRARTLFGAVHGLVSISLDNRFVGLPAGALDDEVRRLIGRMLGPG